MSTTVLNDIETALRRILPAGVSSSVGMINDPCPPLPEGEQAATGRMRNNRLREFSAGRARARAALQDLGLFSPIVPVGVDRGPVWPQGFVGSISHGGELALAVAAPSTVMRAIGTDIEPGVPLDRDLLIRVCRPEEVECLRSSPRPLDEAKLIFSSKESAYKCLAPLAGIFLDFHDLEIQLDLMGGTFRVRGHGPDESVTDCTRINGRFAEAGGYWITVAWQPVVSGAG